MFIRFAVLSVIHLVCVSKRVRITRHEKSLVHIAGEIGCEIDMELKTHTTDITDIDWDAFRCMKKSESGNSGGVYFVQTATRVVVVKPAFGPGDAAAFALSPLPHPKYQVLSPSTTEAGWKRLERAFAMKSAEWLKYFAPETAHTRVTSPVVMELVETVPGVSNLAQLFTPDSYCEGVVDGGCLCPASYQKSLKKSGMYENCDECFTALENHFKTSPLPFNLADLLQKDYPEEVCKLAAFDAFIMEYDQLPDLRDSPFIWNGENVMISPDGHLINIDAGVLHNAFTQEGIESPEKGLDHISELLTDRDSDYKKRMRGQLLTTLLYPALDHLGAQSEQKLSTCEISQRNVTQFLKHPIPGLPKTEEDLDGLWQRCESSIQDELARLADAPLTSVSQAIGAWDWQKCEGEWCIDKDGLVEFLRVRQKHLNTALEKAILGSMS